MKTTTIIGISIAAAVLAGWPLLRHQPAARETPAASRGLVRTETATFAGGCFWCMESPFEKVPGVVEVLSGYIGGSGPNPTYGDYAAKSYIEAIQVTYDPAKVDYARLLDVFWRQIDPTDAGGQFVDRGPQYRSAIFYHNDEQKRLAEESKAALARSGRYDQALVTEIVPATVFYRAEEYHQDFHKKNPQRYHAYRAGSGRDVYLRKIWGKDQNMMKDATTKPPLDHKPSDAALRKMLSPLQYEVTQRNGTEPAFHNQFWDNHRAGIYVDVVSGEPLFSSLDKFESGTGWPSFTKPLEPADVVEKPDTSLLMGRTEVRSKHADSHLGHLFADGPKPTGLRYCINSAALRFIPAADLEKEGYGQYRPLFAK